MRIGLDSNIFLRQAEPGHATCQVALAAEAVLRTRGHGLCILPQNIYEYWVVATRPLSASGLGHDAAQAEMDITRFQTLYTLMPDGPLIFPTWQQFVTTYQVVGKPAHDARIAAALAVHGVTHLLTFNGGDFARFPNVVVLDPQAVASGLAP